MHEEQIKQTRRESIMEILKEETFKTKIFNYDTNKEWKFEGDKPTIVDFYADWCGPCKALSPILEEISTQYKDKLHIYKVDTENSPELASIFGIRSIPSILFIPKDGKPTMAAGLLPKPDLKKAIKDILGVTEPIITSL